MTHRSRRSSSPPPSSQDHLRNHLDTPLRLVTCNSYGTVPSPSPPLTPTPPLLPAPKTNNLDVFEQQQQQQQQQVRAGGRNSRSGDGSGSGSNTAVATARLAEAQGLSMIPPSSIRWDGMEWSGMGWDGMHWNGMAARTHPRASSICLFMSVFVVFFRAVSPPNVVVKTGQSGCSRCVRTWQRFVVPMGTALLWYCERYIGLLVWLATLQRPLLCMFTLVIRRDADK